LHVPLIVRLPDVVPAGVTDDTIVENRLLWSLIDAVLWGDDEQTTPATLANTLRQQETIGAPAFAELYRRPFIADRWKDSPNRHLIERRLRALLVGDMKYIRASDDHHELYNLRKDPQELLNLARLRQADVDVLDGLMDAKVAATDASETRADTPGFSEELKQRLRALGYLD
jgi:arylsulfatase A-like enzyme